jgi:hypothetical protein
MVWVIKATPQPLYPVERPGTHCIGEWVGTTGGLDGCRKFRTPRDSNPGPSGPQRVAIPTETSRPTRNRVMTKLLGLKQKELT